MLILLKAQLIPMETVSLHHLSIEDVSLFIRLYSEKHHLKWTKKNIDDFTALAGGYPLGIIGLINALMNK